MERRKILVVDDESRMRKLVRDFLVRNNYDVLEAEDGEQAVELFFKEKGIALIVLDVMMPRMDGWQVCREIRAYSRVPIIMLTALSGEEEQIRGLDLQVDDYITKPFSMPILIRRIAAVLRRSGREPKGARQLSHKNLVLNLDSYTARVEGADFELTQREFEILRELLTHKGQVLTRQSLLNRLWKYDFYGDERVVDTHIKNLRKKLGIDFIRTVRGVGYKIE